MRNKLLALAAVVAAFTMLSATGADARYWHRYYWHPYYHHYYYHHYYYRPYYYHRYYYRPFFNPFWW
jgi:hypothetical protein